MLIPGQSQSGLGDREIRLVIDSQTAYVDVVPVEPDAPPTLLNSRTVLPIRFVAEALGLTVDWEAETETIVITDSEEETQPTD